MTSASTVPGVGDTAPNVEVRRSVDEAVRLGDLLADGPLVVCFYVFDFGDY